MGKEQKKIRKKKKKRTKENMAQRRKKNTGRNCRKREEMEQYEERYRYILWNEKRRIFTHEENVV